MTPTPPALTDRDALLRQRSRAARSGAPATFLHELVIDEMQERLGMVNRTFSNPLIVSGFPEIWGDFLPEQTLVADEERLSFAEATHDLVVHALGLHWANDPVGQIVQSRLALQPDGFFIAALFGGQTLAELRSVLATAEVELSGGLSPRVAPMGEIRDLGALLQRAGLALPVADTLTQKVSYSSLLALLRDLRAMGEGNALAARSRRPLTRALLARAEELYRREYGLDDGRLPATFEIVFLSGWAPHDSQPQPLAPGSATHALADVLAGLKREGKD